MLLRRRWGNPALRQAETIAQQAIRRAELLNRSVLEVLAGEAVTVIDVTGRVLAVNEPGRRFFSNDGHINAGQNYLNEWRKRAAAGDAFAENILQGIEAVLYGSASQFSIEHPVAESTRERWFVLTAVPVLTEIHGAIISHREVTDEKPAREDRPMGSARPASSSEDFFRALVRSLAATLEARYAFVAEITDRSRSRVRLLAFWSRNGYAEPFEYRVAGTPCEDVIRGRLCYYPSHVQERFPNDMWLKEAGAQSYLAVPLLNQAGQPVGHMGIIHDEVLTEDAPRETILRMFAARAAAEIERSRLEDRLLYEGRLVASANDAIIGMDRNFMLRSWNRAAEEMYGWQAEEVIGRIAMDVLAPAGAGGDHEAMTRGLLYGGEYRGEQTQSRKDGSRIVMEIIAKAVLDENDFVSGYVCVNRDVTDRKSTEEALRAARTNLNDVLDAIPDMMFIQAADGTYLSYIPAKNMETLVPPHLFLGKTPHEVLPAGVADQTLRAITAALTSQRLQSFDYQLEINGEIRDYEARVIPRTADQVLAIVRDYTAQRRQDSAEADRRELEELEGKVEHLMLRTNPYGLTFRELTVLNLVAAGVPDKDIAERLSLSIFTVNKHVANILGKMNALSRTEAAVRAQREGTVGTAHPGQRLATKQTAAQATKV